MKRSDNILSKIFLYGFPVVVVLAVFSILYERGFFKTATGGLVMLHDLTGLVLALWMALTVYLSVRLLISEAFRDAVLTKITFMKERDEREEILTGKATKTTFLMTLALLFFLFCLSCFQVSVYRVPPDKAVNGKTGVVKLGVGIELLHKPAAPAPAGDIHQKDIFIYNGLPVSTTGVILLLILWHVGWYNYLMRRLA